MSRAANSVENVNSDDSSCPSSGSDQDTGSSLGRRLEGASGSSSRNIGHAFKRYTTASDGVHENRPHKARYSRKEDWVRLVLKSRELTGRATRASTTEKGNRSSTGAWFYGVALVVGVCFFVTETFKQASESSLLKLTAAVTSETVIMNHLRDLSGKTLPSEELLEYKVKFVPWKLSERLMKQRLALDKLRKMPRSSFRRPCLALVCVDLEVTPDALYLITLWKAFQLLGYQFEDGPMRYAWEKNGAFVTILQFDSYQCGLGVDWLKFEGVLLSSLKAKADLASFLQDPFKDVLVIWILHEEFGGKDAQFFGSSGKNEALFMSDKRIFERANVVLLSDYVLALKYSHFDTGNFFVLPGSPICEWKAEDFMSSHSREVVRNALNLSVHDVVVAVVGSPFSYRSIWREHAIIMQAIALLTRAYKESFPLKLVFSSAGLQSGYDRALQILATQVGFASGTVSLFDSGRDLDELLFAADVIAYSSLREEQAFPDVLLKAMVFGRPVVAPNVTVIREFIQDGIQGYLFRVGDKDDLARASERALYLSGALGDQEGEVRAKRHGQGLLVAKVISGFAVLLESVIEFPAEAHLPLPISSLLGTLEKDWQRELLEVSKDHLADSYLKVQTSWTDPHTVQKLGGSISSKLDSESREVTSPGEKTDELTLADWADFRVMRLAEEMEQSEEEQLKERNEQLQGTWEKVYRSVRKKERMKNELHEREDGELERIGQPICVYEPYIGIGTWPLLGQKSMMYRGISLISKQRRPGSDDIDASLRLPLLNHTHYLDVFCGFGAFLAIANHIDRIHKNAWIGFQSWQANGRKVSLSEKAEAVLYDAVKGRKNGDTVYFWASTDSSSRSTLLLPTDFWSYCDTINNGNCRHVFLRTFKEMYALSSDWNRLPPMPMDGDRWSALHSWAMPTPSFMEFIMFSRMFVSALDSFYSETPSTCNLGSSASEVRHCYCRLLELLINVWVYHSGRRMVYIDPESGSMNEQHNLSSRHGHMWVGFFSYETLKEMDADLAEEADDEPSTDKKWLWPRTGEVFCQKIYERERNQRDAMRQEKRKRDKERIRRIRGRQRQQPLARG